MLNKVKVLNRVVETGVVAVIRGQDIEEAIKIASSSLEGGIDILEITFTVPKANIVIERLVDMYGDKAVVGAGTILDSETARFAILSGAQFIVGPNFDLETAKLCNKYAIPYMAGCMTINEIIKAMEGYPCNKAFPRICLWPIYDK